MTDGERRQASGGNSPTYTLTVEEDGSYVYAYGPKGLQGFLANKAVIMYAAFASLGGLTFGYASLSRSEAKVAKYMQL